MAELKQRNLDEVKALSRDEAVEIMRQAGIVGAGGGGFPTYFKWKNPQPNLIVNCTESEPGYWADKVLHREYFDEFLELFDVMKTIFGIESVIMGVHFKDEEWFSRYDENADGLYEVVHVPDKYSMGEEKTLIKNIFNEDKGKWVPRRVELPDGNKRPGLPLDAGHIVNNSETLLNIYNAFFLGKPVTTKYLQVFGPDLELKLFEAPLGSSATELVKLAGVDVEAEAGNLSVIDGGPYLNEMGIESLGEGDAYVQAHHQRLPRHPQGRRLQGVRGDQDQASRGRHLAGRQGQRREHPARRPVPQAGYRARLRGGRGLLRAEDRRARRRGLLHRRLVRHGRHRLLHRGGHSPDLRRRDAPGGGRGRDGGRSGEVGFLRLQEGRGSRPGLLIRSP